LRATLTTVIVVLRRNCLISEGSQVISGRVVARGNEVLAGNSSLVDDALRRGIVVVRSVTVAACDPEKPLHVALESGVAENYRVTEAY
jgi:hypothetical protein